MLITQHKTTQDLMVENFFLELKDIDKMLVSRDKDIRGRAEARKIVVLASLEELKKQVTNPYRHAMLQEGVNPNEA